MYRNRKHIDLLILSLSLPILSSLASAVFFRSKELGYTLKLQITEHYTHNAFDVVRRHNHIDVDDHDDDDVADCLSPPYAQHIRQQSCTSLSFRLGSFPPHSHIYSFGMHIVDTHHMDVCSTLNSKLYSDFNTFSSFSLNVGDG